MFATIDGRTYMISNLKVKRSAMDRNGGRPHISCRPPSEREVVMSWLRKAVAGAATGAVLFGFGLDPGHAQVGLRATTPSTETNRQLEVLGKVLDIVRSDYVDKPDDAKLLSAAIDGILKSLDPHSSYMDAKSYRDMQTTTSG